MKEEFVEREKNIWYNSRGFTLVEIMAVIAIIGILSALSVWQFRTSHTKARRVLCINNMRIIDSAVIQYILQNQLSESQYNEVSLKTLVGEHYLVGEPKCPAAGGVSYIIGENGVVCPASDSEYHGRYKDGDYYEE